VDPLVLGPLLKALVERLQVALVLLAEVPVALDLVAEHPMVAVLVVAALMVHQVIVVPEPMVLPTGHPVVTQVIADLEAIALPAEARVMTDHPAMETVGPPVVGTAAVMVVVMAAGTVVVMVEVMAEATVVVMAEATVVAMAVAMAAETNRSYQKKTPPFPLTCDEFSANASTIRTLPESFMM
jgi:Na+/phosphate symporter